MKKQSSKMFVSRELINLIVQPVSSREEVLIDHREIGRSLMQALNHVCVIGVIRLCKLQIYASGVRHERKVLMSLRLREKLNLIYSRNWFHNCAELN